MTSFTEIDVDEITHKVDRFSKLASICVINLKGNKMAQSFKTRVDALHSTVPVVFYLRDQALKDRHWEEIYGILQMRPNLSDPQFTLSSLIDQKVHLHKEKIEEIAMKANQEIDLEAKIEKLQTEWKKAVLDTKQYKE
jgi:dynein heavy chain